MRGLAGPTGFRDVRAVPGKFSSFVACPIVAPVFFYGHRHETDDQLIRAEVLFSTHGELNLKASTATRRRPSGRIRFAVSPPVGKTSLGDRFGRNQKLLAKAWL